MYLTLVIVTTAMKRRKGKENNSPAYPGGNSRANGILKKQRRDVEPEAQVGRRVHS